MSKPRTLAAILVLGALAAPALAQGAGGSDNSPPANSQPATGNQGASGQPAPGTPQPPGASAAPSSPATPGPRPAAVRNPTADVQERLQQLGLYNGDIDGKWGPQTRRAVVDFQRSHHLQPTGTLNVATIARLNQATQSPQSAQGNGGTQEPTPDTGTPQDNTAQAAPPPPRRPGASTGPGFATSPGSSTAARATVAAPGMGFGDTIGGNAAPAIGGGNNPQPGFFGYNLDLSNGFNAAIGRDGR